MKKTVTRGIALLAAITTLVSFAGCLRFTNSLDLSAPLTTAPQSHIQQPTGESDTPSSIPAVTDTDTSAPSDTADTTLPAAEPSSATPAESTTAQNGTQPENTTAAQSIKDYVKSLGNTEYDILRSNNCQIEATLESGGETNPMVLSIAPDKLYIESEMENIRIGMYVEGKKTYIYLPKQKSYLKLSSTVAKLIGMNPEEFAAMADDLGFDSLPPLNTATEMQDVKLDGVSCKRFTVRSADETLRVYLNGKKLLAMDYLNEDGSVGSTMRFTSVKSGFPAMPPAGYSEIGYMDFAKIIMSEME